MIENRAALVRAFFAAAAVVGVPAALAQGCAGGDDACSPNLPSIQQIIFKPSCATAGCHEAKDPAAGLDLSVADPTSQLVGVTSATCDGMLVVPGSPDASYLYQKIALATPECGDHMPIGEDLPPDQKACIEGWIRGLPAIDGGSGDGGDGGECEMCGGSACVDLKVDPAHCGDCATACPAGGSCSGGACACAGGLAACGGQCVDTMKDAANCGGCSMPCPSGAVCDAAQCTCAAGLSVCGGACVDKSSDASNCGACGTVCTGAQVCNNGSCTNGCGQLTKCGASCVDTKTSATNCGSCGNVCPGGASCVASACVCPAGTSACGGQCINTATDPVNCGGCGVVCAQGTTCQASSCMCPGGGVVCGNTCIDSQNDPANCGACGNVCAVGQTCAGGACTCGSASVSFSAAVQPILLANCATNGCHKGVAAQENLDMSTAAKSYQNLVGVLTEQCNDGRKRVLPGQPSQSYVIHKMMDVNLCFGTKMPKLGALPPAKIQTVADWICAGAPNN